MDKQCSSERVYYRAWSAREKYLVEKVRPRMFN